MTKEIEKKEIKVQVAVKIAELVGELSRIKLKEPKEHPWEMYLSGLSKKERRVSRMACEPLPDLPTEELIQKLEAATKKILSQNEDPLYIHHNTQKVNETTLTQPSEIPRESLSPNIHFFPDLTSEDEVIDSLTSSEDSSWMSIGIIEKQGKKFLFSSGDHLAADGNTFMKIFSAIQQEIKKGGDGSPEKYISYKDREKNICTYSFTPEQEVHYPQLYESTIKTFVKNRNKEGNLSVVFPVKEKVAGHERMLPVHIPINVEKISSNDLEEQLRNAIKNPQKLDSTPIRWIRLLNETKDSRASLYTLLHNSALGKEADRYFKGDILFSVMDAQEPISSTTIVPQEKTLVCTVVRNPDTKNVLSFSLSGNELYWDMEKLGTLAETIIKNLNQTA